MSDDVIFFKPNRKLRPSRESLCRTRFKLNSFFVQNWTMQDRPALWAES